jgi:hypothetical protein
MADSLKEALLSQSRAQSEIATPLAKHPSASSRARRQGYVRDSRKLHCSREDSVKNRTPPYTLNEREHLRLVTRLRIWGRSSESFAREWDRGGRFDWLPELSILSGGVSKHLKVLEQAGLIRREIQGRTHSCSLETERLREAAEWLAYYQRFWEQRLDALESFLESKHNEKTL